MQLIHRNRGFSLIELMVALVVGSMFTLSAVVVMSNSLARSSDSVRMVQLSQELRSTLSMVSSEVRRSGFDIDPLAFYQSSQAITSGLAMGTLDGSGNANCLRVSYEDKAGVTWNAVYRLFTTNSIGRVSINMDAAATCATASGADGWAQITDPTLTHVTALNFSRVVDEKNLGINAVTGNNIMMGTETVLISITGQLVEDATISRTVENEINLRNRYLSV